MGKFTGNPHISWDFVYGFRLRLSRKAIHCLWGLSSREAHGIELGHLLVHG
jgi:hypothetical protein